MKTSERVMEATRKVFSDLQSLSHDELREILEKMEFGGVGKLLFDIDQLNELNESERKGDSQ